MYTTIEHIERSQNEFVKYQNEEVSKYEDRMCRKQDLTDHVFPLVDNSQELDHEGLFFLCMGIVSDRGLLDNMVPYCNHSFCNLR